MKSIIYIIISITLFGCANQGPDPVDENSSLLLKEITKNNIIISSFKYDSENKISQIDYFLDDGTFQSRRVYNYANDTLIIDYFNNINSLYQKAKYYEVTSESFRINYYNSDNTLRVYRLYTFDELSCSFSRMDIYNPIEELTYQSNFIDLDLNCSSEVTSYDFINDLSFKEYIYRDNNHGYLQQTRAYFFRSENLGNITKRIYEDENSQTITSKSYSSSYKYNFIGYPTYEKRTYFDDNIEEYEFTYY
ncbi:MAG: hypothetical protein KDC79_02985 [Cyclobacteriaceae bacterium]|nr:hypothetical protein [Cyclobacteriaceae bacterium]